MSIVLKKRWIVLKEVDYKTRIAIWIKKDLHQELTYFEVYVLSDEPIADMDWYIRMFDETLQLANQNSDHKHYDCKKVIATTDQKIKIAKSQYDSFPAPSDSFLKKLIHIHNNSTDRINVILVEYENNKLKINGKDNTITIRKFEPNYKGFMEELWNREDQGLPIDRSLLIEMSNKYFTPIPGTVEWEKEGFKND